MKLPLTVAASLLAANIMMACTHTDPAASLASAASPSRGWNLTVYYTAVENLHSGAPQTVQGCLDNTCSSKGKIGDYPADFIQFVRDEGTGRITSGTNAGKYLNWSKGTQYWLDTAPRNAQGTALIPWKSAAADSFVMNFGTTFKVVDCGTDDSGGGPIDFNICNQLKQANWQIMDRFETGRGGNQRLDLYIGEEDQVNFVNTSPKEISTKSAVIAIGST